MPKTYGMLQRKNNINKIDCSQQVISIDYANPLGEALGHAKYVNFLNLRSCSLSDEAAIAILSKIDRAVVTHIDLSDNPNLTAKFYEWFSQFILELGTNIKCLEIEKN